MAHAETKYSRCCEPAGADVLDASVGVRLRDWLADGALVCLLAAAWLAWNAFLRLGL